MRKHTERIVSLFNEGFVLSHHLLDRDKGLRARSITILFFFTVVLIGLCSAALWIDTCGPGGSNFMMKAIKTLRGGETPKHNRSPQHGPETKLPVLNCSAGNMTRTCPATSPVTFQAVDGENNTETSVCPEYFRWIHEDLKPWKEKGIRISKEMVERARKTAKFRLVIVNGRAYVEKYRKAIQTRDVITLWGILQLLRRYPGRLPDLDLMFDCHDRPVIRARRYRDKGPNATAPPPLFRNCGDQGTLDIVFPDWSFWGWHEINIKPWDATLKELKDGNERSKWIDREPYAYWKGNPFVAPTRKDLMKCNVSEKDDWNARLYTQVETVHNGETHP